MIWNPCASRSAIMPRITTSAHARRTSSGLCDCTAGGRTRNERVSGGSTTKSYEKTSYDVSSSEVLGNSSVVSGRQPGVTMDRHLMSCLKTGFGNICSQRRARDKSLYETGIWGPDGVSRTDGDDEARRNALFPSTMLRLFSNRLSCGGVFIGDWGYLVRGLI